MDFGNKAMHLIASKTFIHTLQSTENEIVMCFDEAFLFMLFESIRNIFSEREWSMICWMINLNLLPLQMALLVFFVVRARMPIDKLLIIASISQLHHIALCHRTILSETGL